MRSITSDLDIDSRFCGGVVTGGSCFTGSDVTVRVTGTLGPGRAFTDSFSGMDTVGSFCGGITPEMVSEFENVLCTSANTASGIAGGAGGCKGRDGIWITGGGGAGIATLSVGRSHGRGF